MSDIPAKSKVKEHFDLENSSNGESRLKSNSRRKVLACGFIVALIAFSGLNLLAVGTLNEPANGLTKEALLKRSEESSQEGSWSFWVARNYLMREKAPQVMLFGSSLIGSATFSSDTETLRRDVDCVVDRRAATLEKDLKLRLGANTEVLHASIPGSMASDAYLISNALFKPDNQPQLVIIGVNPRDFIDNTLSAPADTEPFHFYSRYVELGNNLPGAAFGDLFGYLDWACHRYVPFKRLNASLGELSSRLSRLGKKGGEHPRTLVSHLNTKRTFMQIFLGGGNNIRKGEWMIHYPMPIGFLDNTREYLNRYKNPSTALYPREKKFFNAFLSKLQNDHIKALVVNMPSTPQNRAILPESFRNNFNSYLNSSCTKYGADYLDLAGDFRFVKTDYLDTVHLNAAGGARLSRIISAKIGASPSLSAAAIPQQLPAELRSNIQTSTTNSVWR